MIWSAVTKTKRNTDSIRGYVWLLRAICAGLGIVFFVLSFRTARATNLLKAAQCAGMFVLSFLPRFFKMEHTPSAAFFSLFLLLAGIGGSVLGLYERFRFYDVFTHLLSGALCVMLLADYLRTRNIFFSKKAFFGAAAVFALACAAGWEMYEFVVLSMLKNTSFSLQTLAGELGVSTAVQTAGIAIKENVALTFETVNALIRNAYDTFCDVLCALIGAIACALWKPRLNTKTL